MGRYPNQNYARGADWHKKHRYPGKCAKCGKEAEKTLCLPFISGRTATTRTAFCVASVLTVCPCFWMTWAWKCPNENVGNMTIREKLIEILSVPIYPHEQADPAAAVADYLLDNGVTVQQWIPVEERLPESLVLVVALTTGGDRIIAQRDKYGWLRYGGYECERLRPITHWMPLPEPPTEV